MLAGTTLTRTSYTYRETTETTLTSALIFRLPVSTMYPTHSTSLSRQRRRLIYVVLRWQVCVSGLRSLILDRQGRKLKGQAWPSRAPGLIILRALIPHGVLCCS